jgi:hypothetical protein
MNFRRLTVPRQSRSSTDDGMSTGLQHSNVREREILTNGETDMETVEAITHLVDGSTSAIIL